MANHEALFGQVVDEARVELGALVQLHARWARRRGYAADPQVAESATEVLRLLGLGTRSLRLIACSECAATDAA